MDRQGNLDSAARDAHIVHVGAMGGTKLRQETDISAFIRKRVRFEGSSLRSRDVAYQVCFPPFPSLSLLSCFFCCFLFLFFFLDVFLDFLLGAGRRE